MAQGVNAVHAAGRAGGADARAAVAETQEQPHGSRVHAGARRESAAVSGCNRGKYSCSVYAVHLCGRPRKLSCARE